MIFRTNSVSPKLAISPRRGSEVLSFRPAHLHRELVAHYLHMLPLWRACEVPKYMVRRLPHASARLFLPLNEVATRNAKLTGTEPGGLMWRVDLVSVGRAIARLGGSRYR